MANVRIYTTPWCPYCQRAKALLASKNVSFEEVDVDGDPSRRDEMTRLSGGYTVPQIFIDDKPIGGCDDLHDLDARGELDGMLAANP